MDILSELFGNGRKDRKRRKRRNSKGASRKASPRSKRGKSSKKEEGTTTISIATSICTPARGRVLTAFKPYGVKVHSVDAYSIYSNGTTGRDGDGARRSKGEDGEPTWEYPTAYVVDLTVNRAAVEWVEYLALRYGFSVLGEHRNKNNQAWAQKWGGKMPEGWAEPGCKRRKEKESRK